MIGIIMTQTEGLRGHRPYARLLRLDHTHTTVIVMARHNAGAVLSGWYLCVGDCGRQADQLIKCSYDTDSDSYLTLAHFYSPA